MWFYFAVQGAQSGQKVLFNVVGYSKTKSLYRDGMAPVVCTSGRPHWERMPEGTVYFYRSPRHGRQYVLSFPFCFERANEVYYFAYCFPYTYSYLQRFLHSLDERQLPCYRRECLGRTVQQRKLDLITISSPENLELDEAAQRQQPPRKPIAGLERRNLVFVTSRVHPGETPASFLMHGLLLFLTSEHPRAQALRQAVVVKAVPMLNPDGVFLGNYRCNSLGLDLNRQWDAPQPWASPTIHAVRELAREYNTDPSHPMALHLFIDVHAHSTCMNCFVFANMPDDGMPKSMESVAAFPKVLSGHMVDLAQSGPKFCNDPAKLGTGRRALGDILPGVHSYTLELSFFSAAQGNIRGEAYSPQSYTDMGVRLGMALHEYFSTHRNGAGTAVVPQRMPPQMPQQQPPHHHPHQPHQPQSQPSQSQPPQSQPPQSQPPQSHPQPALQPARSGRGASAAANSARRANRPMLATESVGTARASPAPPGAARSASHRLGR